MLKFVRETLNDCRISMKWAIRAVAEVACIAIDKVLSAIIGA